MKGRALGALTFVGLAIALTGLAAAQVVDLDQLDLTAMSSGWGEPRVRQSVTEGPLSIGGVAYERGIGTHAESEWLILLDGQAQEFTARVGVDDRAGDGRGAVEFTVYGDGRELWTSGVCRWQEKAKLCRVDVAGIRELELVVSDGGNGIDFDHADWADAAIRYAGQKPRAEQPPVPEEEFILLTPPPPDTPRINGPRVYGVRPGSPILFRVPTTGARPMEYAAEGLPSGAQLDPVRGIIAGSIAEAGTYRVTLIARNARGEDRRELRFEVGQQLALTPPMGWNSWYIHYDRVSEAVMRQAAEQMIASGMADFGYQYVNIDDCWMVKPESTDAELAGPPREADGKLRPNRRFPDLPGMVETIHAHGLKAGIYISPGPRTCAGFEGSWQHEALDARTFADWGFDFLKYDWCSYGSVAGGSDREHLQAPYRLMASELQKLDRDIVLNLCQYGMGDVWEWGGEFGHCWRTTGDLGLERGGRLPGFYRIALSNARHDAFARPGAWNDPDYLLIGWVGDAHGMGQGEPTHLTANEQYSYMSLWSLMAAPLIFSGDMAKLDPFTLNVLCNHEVIDVDQDPLGRQGRVVRHTRHEFVLAKPLEDGSLAVGLFNLSSFPRTMAATWSELGVAGPQRLRDVWRQRDLGEFAEQFSAEVPRHGVAFVRLFPKTP